MATPFDEYTLEKARKIVQGRFDDQAAINVDFYNGDHWGPQGEYWVGPRPDATSMRYQGAMDEIKRAFVSHNVVGEVTTRHTGGVLSRELHWAFTPDRELKPVITTDPATGEEITEEGQPTAEENDRIAEAQAALVEWWDRREVTEILQAVLDGALAMKRSPMRLFVPPGSRDSQGNLPRGDLAQCLNYIYLQSLAMNEDTLDMQVPSATVYVDQNSRREVGIFLYKENDQDFAELSYLDDVGNTVLRIVGKEGDLEQRPPLPLGGRLLHYELTRRQLVTPQIVSQQKALNMSATMKLRNVVQGGFLERILLNVKWPTEERYNPDTGKVELVPKPMVMGAGITNSFQGATFTDENGVTHVLPPDVIYHDPVTPDTFISTEDSYYLSILKETAQLHYALAGDGAVSEVSRKQARDAFQKDLLLSAGKIESAVRWILETALAMASYFAAQPNRYAGLRSSAQCHVDSGPVSPDDLRVAAEMEEKGIWDWETAASATGVDDVDAMRQRIERERAKKQARAMQMQAQQPQEQEEQGQNGEQTTPVAEEA